MKNVLFFLIFLLPAIGLTAQEIPFDPQDPVFRERYREIDFNGGFSVLVMSDTESDYYVADFSSLASRFEKIWFLNLVFRGDRVVVMNADPTGDQAWFKAERDGQSAKVHEYLLGLKKKSEEAALRYTKEEQDEWLKKNDKYGNDEYGNDKSGNDKSGNDESVNKAGK